MKYNDIKRIIAPCGLNCSKCMGYEYGDIKRVASELKKLLGSFDSYAQRFSHAFPVFSNYPAFKDILNHFCAGNCRGCREGGCRYPGCVVAQCHIKEGVDFCFQCGKFPCDKTNFDSNLYNRWLNMNREMKEYGIEKYYDKTKNLPRYI